MTITADPTEGIRRSMVQDLNRQPDGREDLEAKYGQVWDTQELGRDFNVKGFMAPFIFVIRKTDNQQGTLLFQHYPRFYFDFTPNGGAQC